MDELVIGVGDMFAAVWVQQVQKYVDSTPAVLEALQAANAVAVVFEHDGWARSGGEEFFGAVQAGLQAAEAAVPAGKRGLFIAVVRGSDARESNAFVICGRERTGACPPLVSARGLFLGYLVLGEGGALFTDDRGDDHGVYSEPDYILGRIRALTPDVGLPR